MGKRMKSRSGVLAVLLMIGVVSPAFAQSAGPKSEMPQMGTSEQRAACGPDVGRYCKAVKPDEGAFGYLACLKTNRDKLRPACRAVLESNGQ
jgi:hypothetical protein